MIGGVFGISGRHVSEVKLGDVFSFNEFKYDKMGREIPSSKKSHSYQVIKRYPYHITCEDLSDGSIKDFSLGDLVVLNLEPVWNGIGVDPNLGEGNLKTLIKGTKAYKRGYEKRKSKY